MDCIFCKIANGEMKSNTLYEDDTVKVIMDINPVVDGHILVIPKNHYTDFMELDNDVTTHIFSVAKKMAPLLMEKLNKKSVTLLVNYGDDQQVKHYHLHLLPDFGVVDVRRNTRTAEETFEILTK